MRNTVLVECARQETLQVFELEDLTDYEFQVVLDKFPRLSCLSTYERTSFLLRRPFYLDLLTRRENPLDEADLPEQLTEAWFLRFFWKDVVCRGQPHHKREQVLLQIARYGLTNDAIFTPAAGFDSQELNSLISDQIVTVEEWEFAQLTIYLRIGLGSVLLPPRVIS